jgi:hypothetical protein
MMNFASTTATHTISHRAENVEDPAELEAYRRNAILTCRHGKLPSYALWDAESVGPPESWQQWWLSVPEEWVCNRTALHLEQK